MNELIDWLLPRRPTDDVRKGCKGKWPLDGSTIYLIRHHDGLGVDVVQDGAPEGFFEVHHGDVDGLLLAAEERLHLGVGFVEGVEPLAFEVDRVGHHHFSVGTDGT